mmetsp:Transcript_11437/g.26052  ORF Transcript_11437/g.26052 Transcript_11437/m.26052 type:complete len:321 (-) Transcript_11437:1489-2451(-)
MNMCQLGTGAWSIPLANWRGVAMAQRQGRGAGWLQIPTYPCRYDWTLCSFDFIKILLQGFDKIPVSLDSHFQSLWGTGGQILMPGFLVINYSSDRLWVGSRIFVREPLTTNSLCRPDESDAVKVLFSELQYAPFLVSLSLQTYPPTQRPKPPWHVAVTVLYEIMDKFSVPRFPPRVNFLRLFVSLYQSNRIIIEVFLEGFSQPLSNIHASLQGLWGTRRQVIMPRSLLLYDSRDRPWVGLRILVWVRLSTNALHRPNESDALEVIYAELRHAPILVILPLRTHPPTQRPIPIRHVAAPVLDEIFDELSEFSFPLLVMLPW